MKNSVSDHSFIIDSEDEEEVLEEGKEVSYKGYEDGNESDTSESSSIGSAQQNKPSSYNTTWPQSYRYMNTNFCSLLMMNE